MFFKHQTDADTVTLLAYWTDSNFAKNTNADSVFGAKVQVLILHVSDNKNIVYLSVQVSIKGKTLWYLGFRGQPTGYVQITHKSTTRFPQ